MTRAPIQIAPDVFLRHPTPEDAEGLARAYLRSRDHLRQWEPDRDEAFFTPAGQAERLRTYLAETRAGRMMPWLMVSESQEAAGQSGIIGTVMLTNITLGPLRSSPVGYWIDPGHVGRGLATAALKAVCTVADTQLGLHRLEAGTLLENTASQRVLAKCGFVPFGLAEKYLHIHGAWRDHRLFQKILNDRRP
ncbi:GNAT family protein [Streptomyces sp. Pv4-95]|uniref:GNAT family N-acetyltransferase n=1 Tax=Streptomyces sp. Pv4-95 TaxID=3049543 RepID=UPI00389197AC